MRDFEKLHMPSKQVCSVAILKSSSFDVNKLALNYTRNKIL